MQAKAKLKWALIVLGIVGASYWAIFGWPIMRAKNALSEHMLDPESVIFRNTSIVNGVVCGEFNAKNRMGGYVGFRRFYVPMNTLTPSIESDDVIFDGYLRNCR